eukprot:jgi/Ulvmu1/444/UM001_0451.1
MSHGRSTSSGGYWASHAHHLLPSIMQVRSAFMAFQSQNGLLDDFGLACASAAILGRQLTLSERAQGAKMVAAEGSEGHYTFSTWTTFIAAVLMQSDQNQILRKMFRQLDRSCTGRISRNEWLLAVDHTLPWVSAAKASDAFDMLLPHGAAALAGSTFVCCMLQSVPSSTS